MSYAVENGLLLKRSAPGKSPKNKNMKIILLLISVVTLLTAGCIFPGPRGGGEFRGEGYRGHREFASLKREWTSGSMRRNGPHRASN